MKQLLIHSLVVSPIVGWITSPARRWSRKFGLNLAIGVLIVLALLQVVRMESNCLDLVGVGRLASKSEIAKAFRKQSITFHPDRPAASLPHGFASSSEVFMELQKCYEILSNDQAMSHYSRFGDIQMEAFSSDSTMLPVMAVFAFIGYVVHFIVCTTLTSGRETKRSMYWIASFLFFAFSSEMFMKYLGFENLFGGDSLNWMVFEQIAMIKGLIPSVLSSGILLSRLTYVNELDLVDTVVTSVHESNKQIAAHVVQSRDITATAPILVPAVLQLGKPLPPPPNVAPIDPSIPAKTSIWQTLLRWIFLAYMAKSIYSVIRSFI